jgi:hypothetical protein
MFLLAQYLVIEIFVYAIIHNKFLMLLRFLSWALIDTIQIPLYYEFSKHNAKALVTS